MGVLRSFFSFFRLPLWAYSVASSLVTTIPYVVLQSLSVFSLPADERNSIPFGGQVALLVVAFLCLGGLAGMCMIVFNAWWLTISLLAAGTIATLYVSLAVGGLVTNGIIFLSVALALTGLLAVLLAWMSEMRLYLPVGLSLFYISCICLLLLAWQASMSSSNSSNPSSTAGISATDATLTFINPPLTLSPTSLRGTTYASAVGDERAYDYLRANIITDGTATLQSANLGNLQQLNVVNIAATGISVTTTAQGNTLTDGTATLSRGILSNLVALNATNAVLECLQTEASGTGANQLPSGTTAERPAISGNGGQLRFNTDSSYLEFSNGTAWTQITTSGSGGGGGGGGGDFSPTITSPATGQTLLYGADGIWRNNPFPKYVVADGNYTMSSTDTAVLIVTEPESICNSNLTGSASHTTVTLPPIADVGEGQTITITRSCPYSGAFLVDSQEDRPMWKCWDSLPFDSLSASMSFVRRDNSWVVVSDLAYLTSLQKFLGGSFQVFSRPIQNSRNGRYVVGTNNLVSQNYGVTSQFFGLYPRTQSSIFGFSTVSQNGKFMYRANMIRSSSSSTYTVEFYRSSDFGTTWTTISNTITLSSTISDLLTLSTTLDGQSVFFFQYGDTFIYRSDDFGETWTQLSIDEGIDLSMLSVNNNGTLIVASGVSFVYIQEMEDLRGM